MTRLLLLTVGLCACESEGPPAPSAAPVGPIPEETLPGVTQPELGTVPPAEPDLEHARRKRRMTIAQVRDSMERISGGVAWGEAGASDWDTYAATLSVADYQTRTKSDRTPSVLFQKFLDDAAAQTCAGWMTAPQSTFFVVDDPQSVTLPDVRANIIGLRWQIQGRPLSEDAPVIDDYVDLFATVYRRTDRTAEAWHIVCVAMFTHPAFFMY